MLSVVQLKIIFFLIYVISTHESFMKKIIRGLIKESNY